MVAYSLAQRLTPNRALVAAGAIGMVAALAALLIPGLLFEDMVLTSGVAAFVPAAEPPLGMTARLCLAVLAGGGAALLSWSGLSLFMGVVQPRLTHAMRRSPVRRADAHPDAPPREPFRAGRDLGFDEGGPIEAAEPLDLDLPPEPAIAMGAPAPTAARSLALDIPADPPPPPPVQPLPADLDQPLAAFDPAALPEAPLVAPRTVTPLVRTLQSPVLAAGERFETFDLARPVANVAPASAMTAPETVATVHSLLDRLELGMARRAQPELAPAPVPAPEGLASALEKLRRMAASG